MTFNTHSLSFMQVKDEIYNIYLISIPNHINLFFEDDKKYIFSFNKYTNFDMKTHGKALEYIFNVELVRHVENKDVNNEVVLRSLVTFAPHRSELVWYENNEVVWYEFKNVINIKKNVSKELMLFLCGVFYNLDLQTYLMATIRILMNDYKMKFEKIKNYSKSKEFNMDIFCN